MKPKVFEFNKGISQIRMEYSVPNLAWFVWRDDNGHVPRGLFRIHNDKESAIADFNRRVEFIKSMGAA